MNWKKYKSLPPEEQGNENFYIIGLDLGSHSSGLAFYNLSTRQAEVIDMSGGYGKPSIPTVMQYIPESKEWVFGEYAVLNQGTDNEITLRDMLSLLGQFEYINVDKRNLSVASILGLFIKEVLGNVRNINPNGQIVGIVATTPAFATPQVNEELTRAFKSAGYEKELIALVPDRTCALTHYLYTAEVAENIMLLDFGATQLRGGAYHIQGSHITATQYYFNQSAGTQSIDASTTDYLSQFTGNVPQLAAFTHQHKDMLFSRNIGDKPVKLYFNFTYPPTMHSVTAQDIAQLLSPHIKTFEKFIQPMYNRDITIICTGGGFEMQWARDSIEKICPQAILYKNPKMVQAQGAALVAANYIMADPPSTHITLTDTNQLPVDIGLFDGKNFLPLAERNTFWWQHHTPKLILVNQTVHGDLDLTLATRTKDFDIMPIGIAKLKGLPKRPKGVTRLRAGLTFATNHRVTLTIADMGFGELYPQVDYSQETTINIPL